MSNQFFRFVFVPLQYRIYVIRTSLSLVDWHIDHMRPDFIFIQKWSSIAQIEVSSSLRQHTFQIPSCVYLAEVPTIEVSIYYYAFQFSSQLRSQWRDGVRSSNSHLMVDIKQSTSQKYSWTLIFPAQQPVVTYKCTSPHQSSLMCSSVAQLHQYAWNLMI